MNRVDRLFGILTLLQSRKFVPCEKIAEKFGISVRSVYRDIRALNEQGVPVSFEPNRGYFIVNGFFLQPVAFTTEEANALLTVEQLVSGFADRSIQQGYSSALTKVRAVLRGNQKDSVEKLSDHIRFQAPPCFVQQSGHLAVIQSAITANRVLEIDYSNAKKENSRRRAEPIGLVFYAFSWHLIGWCHLKKDYRDFKVSRIVSLRITDLPFTRTNHMALGEYMKQLPVSY
jgi:predicted DNA-binding transcriptional regulator YafY